jgi:hypothetical protein
VNSIRFWQLKIFFNNKQRRIKKMSTRKNAKDHKEVNILNRLNFGRRTFLKGLMVSGLGVISGGLIRPPSGSAKEKIKVHKHHKYIKEQPRKVPIIEDVDVLVVGGGMAGVGAAVAAGRLGAKTLLVEYYGCLGGNGTSGMVNNFCGYTTRGSGADRFQIVQGIGGEIHQKLYDKGGAPSLTQYNFNPEILKIVFDEMVAEADIQVLYYTQMVDTIFEKNKARGVIIENKGRRQAILAERVVDCTGDGDVCAFAGVPFELGDGQGNFLACDLAFHLINVGDYDGSVLRQKIEEAIASGAYGITRSHAIIIDIVMDGAYWVNWAGVPWAVNGVDPYHLSQAAVDGRKVVRELRRFLRAEVPGFENADVVDTAPKMGLRETRRVMGEHLLNKDEVLAATKFEDGIGACAWAVEIVDPVHGRTFEWLPDGEFYTIPYRILLPQDVENLLMAGRFVSCTHEAQASTRVMGPAVVMGQAAGTAAALSIQERVKPRNLNVGFLQNELAAAGAFLG